MSLSSMWRPRRFLGGAAFLGSWLVAALPAAAQTPLHQQLPLNLRGFGTTMALQSNWQRSDDVSRRPAAPAAAVATPEEPRQVTIVGPDGRTRSFTLEGPVSVMPARPAVVHFGASVERPTTAFAPRAGVIHFGSNH